MMANTVANWHRVVETRDAAGLNALLAENAVFHSPVVHTPQVGKVCRMEKRITQKGEYTMEGLFQEWQRES